MSKGAKRAAQALVLLAALLLLWAGERLIFLPAPSDPPGAFSAARATERLARVLGDERPHPVDSAANDAVRERLVAELTALGLRPTLDDGLSCNPSGRTGALACARVRNVRVTLGPADGRHLLVTAHYDSTPVGPGAADDGIGVAAMLETAALLSRRPLARPVTFLFNEGEEAGLLGARAFLARDPLAARVDALVNLESRGTTGPAIMFETSQPNASAVRWLAGAVRRPVANSLATDFYRLIPNSTDVRVLEERPWTILNFAIIANETRYHSPGDTLAALDRRSVQHMGDQLLALATAYADRGLPRAEGTRIFADLWGLGLVHLPAWVGVAGLALAGALLLAAAIRTRAWRGVAATLAAMAGAGAIAFGAIRLASVFRPGEWWRAQPDAMSAALIATALLASLAALWLTARQRPATTLRAGVWVVVLALGALVTFRAPGASIYFLAPPLLAGAGALAGGRAARVLGLAAATLLLLTWAPLVGLIEILLDFDNGWIFALVTALLLVPLLVELRDWAPLPRAAVLLAASALLAAGAWGLVAARPAYSADRKQAFGVEYLADGAASRWLAVNDGAPLPSAFSAFRPGLDVPWSTRPRWSAAAPGDLATAPTATLVGAGTAASTRRLSIRLAANGADALVLHAPRGRVRAVGTGAWSMGVEETAVALPAIFRCRGRSCDGIVVTLDLAGTAPVELTLLGLQWRLPPAAAPLVAARPANAAPQYDPDQSIAVTRLKV